MTQPQVPIVTKNTMCVWMIAPGVETTAEFAILCAVNALIRKPHHRQSMALVHAQPNGIHYFSTRMAIAAHT